MQETWVRSLGWEDLEEEMAAHYSILAWEIPWTEEPGGQATVRGVTKSWTQLSWTQLRSGYAGCWPTHFQLARIHNS